MDETQGGGTWVGFRLQRTAERGRDAMGLGRREGREAGARVLQDTAARAIIVEEAIIPAFKNVIFELNGKCDLSICACWLATSRPNVENQKKWYGAKPRISQAKHTSL